MSSLIPEHGSEIQLGIVGFNEGNGHPYSWSAICNGYDPEKMRENEFPVIAQYLGKENWPEARIPNVNVSSVFCDNQARAKDISRAAHIQHVCLTLDELIERSDAVLLARDDVVQRRDAVERVVKSGKPVFIDKPFATTLEEAESLLNIQSSSYQIFTTSALRYATELYLSEEEKQQLGEITHIYAYTPKSWINYAVHIIEPVVAQFPDQDVVFLSCNKNRGATQVICQFADKNIMFNAMDDCQMGIRIEYFGKVMIAKEFNDAFFCFKKSIEMALSQWHTGEQKISRQQTKKVCQLIEYGMSNQ